MKCTRAHFGQWGSIKDRKLKFFTFLLSFSESLTWLQKGVAAEGGGEGGDKGQRDQTRQLIEASRNTIPISHIYFKLIFSQK